MSSSGRWTCGGSIPRYNAGGSIGTNPGCSGIVNGLIIMVLLAIIACCVFAVTPQGLALLLNLVTRASAFAR